MIAGVIGSGAMGSGIAQVIASAGNQVVVMDTNQQALQRAADSINAGLQKMLSKNLLTQQSADEVVANITFTQDIAKFDKCVLVIEVVVEELTTKQNIFKQLEQVVADTCILATNTSSLSITSIAAACNHPERCIGIHFFNPAAIMQLVEIIPAMQSRKNMADEVKELVASWGKLPVIAKDIPGFIVNRVARPFYGEALRLLDEGIADCATIDWAMTTIGGFKMGPFTLMDFIGIDVNYRVTESVFRSCFFDPRYKPSITQQRLFEAGLYGRKTGRGFYDYAEGATRQKPFEDHKTGQYIVDRILAMLINEAADAVYYKIASAGDLETAMTKGVNYPKGLLQWADDWGIGNVINFLDNLYQTYHEERYRTSVLLRNMHQARSTFHNQPQTAIV